MADFIISPYAISFESIKNNLQNFINNKQEDVWKDFYASSTGETIIELAAALGTFYAFQFISGRRECFLNTAQNYTSLIGLAENLGYNASRGNNLKLRLTITPDQTIINLPKWTTVGSYGEYDIILLEDTTLSAGIQTTIDVVIGNSMVESQVITTTALTQFTFTNPNVTNDYRLILNTNQVPSSDSLADAINDKYVAISNIYGSVDVMYLNIGNYQYKAGDTLYLNFIERNSVTYDNFSLSSITLDYAETLEGATLIADKEDKEDKEKIRVVAPIAHETGNLIRSRKDYSKYLLVNGVDIIDANDKDIYPGLIQLTYLKSDREIMSSAEKAQWLAEIDIMRPGGVAEAIITNPKQVHKDLSITIHKSSDNITNSVLTEQIKEILNKYTNSLSMLLDLDQIEHEIELLDGVKICRISLDTITWAASTAYPLYSSTTNSYGNFYLSGYSFKSGANEPTWSSLNIGNTLLDGQIIWKRIDYYPQEIIDTWTANSSYNQYDCIKKEYVSSEITTTDGTVVWTKTDTTGANTWTASHSYSLNDIISVSIDGVTHYFKCTTAGTSGASEPTWNIYPEIIATYVMQCIGFKGTTSAAQPIWSIDSQTDGTVIWTKTTTTTTNTWAATTNYSVGNLIKVVVSGVDTYYECTTAGTSGSTQPSWLVESINDNDLTWHLTTNTSTTTWVANTNKQIGDIIKVVSSDNYYYEVVNLCGKSGTNAPDWEHPTNNLVYDNTLTWTKVDSINNNIQVGWDEYLDISHTVTVI